MYPPLYLFPDFFRDKPVEKLLANGIKAEEVNDDKIGRVMDKLYEISSNEFWTKIVLNTLKKYEINTKYSHLDSSTISVERESNQLEKISGESEKLVKITYGYSKDNRRDLKQFMIDLMVSNDGDIPLLMRVGDGNESDKKIFAELKKHIKKSIFKDNICNR